MTGASSFPKPFRILAFSFLAVLLLIAITSASVSIIYKKALIRYMKGYLGEHLRTELSMDDIRIRVLKGFPNITIEVSDVVLHSGENFSIRDFPSWADTLLQAKSLYLQFDLVKMLRKQYELKKIEVSDGTINVLFDNNDHNNLSIWKSGGNGGSGYSVNIRNIGINNTRLRIYVLSDRFSLNARTEKILFKGSYASNILAGNAKGRIKIRNAEINNRSLVKNSLLELGVDLAYGGDFIRIPRGKVQLNKAVSDIAFEYVAAKKNTISLSLDIPKFGLEELMSLIPYETRFSTGDYHFTGTGRLHLSVNGITGKKGNLLVRSDFVLNNGAARNSRTHSSVTGLYIKGMASGTNDNDFVVRIDTLNALLGKGFVKAKLSFSNLNSLHFKSQVNSMVDLDALKEFAGIDSIDRMSGMVYSDFFASGRFRDLADSSGRAINMLQKGNFRFDNAGFEIKRIPLKISGVTGKASWNESVRLDSLKLDINKSGMVVSGEIRNLTGYLLHKETLKGYLKINTDIIDITKYLHGSGSTEGERYYGLFPARMHINGQILTGIFRAGKFEAAQVSVKFDARKDSVYLNDLLLHFPDGLISGKALVSMGPHHEYQVHCMANPQKINIQQLFYACDNFTQRFIMDKNLRGELAGNINCSFQWDSTMTLIPGSIIAEGDFQITNGELVQFEPMLKLSKYIDVDELRHIRFKTLSNSIHISNRMVDIPEMDIHSSAFNISVSGKHSFNNEFDYSIRVLLSEVLFNKARKKKKEMNEFLVEDRPQERTTIPLIIAGTPEAFDVRFDRRKAFGLTHEKNKGRLVEDEKPDASKNVRIEWDEPKNESETGVKSTTTKPSDVVIEWEE